MRAPRRAPLVLLEASNIASGVGNAAVMVTIPWLVLDVTGSSASAGLVAAVASLPGLLAAPLAGWFVDHYGRRRVSAVADCLSALSVAGFPLVAAFGEMTLAWVLVLAVLGATFDPAGYTARRAAIPGVAAASGVSVDRLNGVHEGCFAAGWTLGPLVGAALIAVFGPAASFWLPCGLFVFAALAMVLIGSSADVPEVGADGEPVVPTAPAGWRGLFAGVAVLRADRLLRSLSVSVVVLAAIYLPTEAVLLPTHYEALGQPGSMGVVIACLAMGSMVGSFAYGRLSARFTKLQIVRMIMLGTMTAIWPMALLLPLAPMAIASALLGLWWGPYNPLMSTLVQTRVPIDQQGRVYGVQMSLFSAAPPVAMLVVGVVVEWLGVRTTYLALAGVLSVWTLILLRDPALAELDRPVDEATPVPGSDDPVRPHV